MKVILICIALILSTYSVVILQSSPSTTTVVSPVGSTVLTSGSGWIQSSNFASQTVFQSLFYSRCNGFGSITVAISASAFASFNLYFDDILIGSGSGPQSFPFKLNISCGNHNLTVVVLSKGKTNGLTFTVDQDQSNCFNCNSNGFWNEKTCACQCISSKADCPCVKPKTWRDYPVCGCRCPKKGFFQSTGAVQLKASSEASAQIIDFNDDNGEGQVGDATVGDATVDSAKLSILPFPWLCPRPKYFDQLTCSCICHYKYCKPPMYFNPKICKCVWKFGA